MHQRLLYHQRFFSCCFDCLGWCKLFFPLLPSGSRFVLWLLSFVTRCHNSPSVPLIPLLLLENAGFLDNRWLSSLWGLLQSQKIQLRGSQWCFWTMARGHPDLLWLCQPDNIFTSAMLPLKSLQWCTGKDNVLCIPFLYGASILTTKTGISVIFLRLLSTFFFPESATLNCKFTAFRNLSESQIHAKKFFSVCFMLSKDERIFHVKDKC